MSNKEQQRESQLAMIADWQKSGLSQKQYCQQHQIAYHTFYYWFRRSKPVAASKSSGAAFVKVKPATSGQAELVLVDGRRLIFHQPVSAEFLKSLLS